MQYWDAWIALSVVLGLMIMVPVGGKLKIPLVWILTVWFIHQIMSLYYAYYVINFGGDALQYYSRSLMEWIPWTLGTFAVVNIASFLSAKLGVGFVATNMIFGICGSTGILLVLSVINDQSSENKHKYFKNFMFAFIALSPSFHFWSSALGKDSISILACGLFIRGIASLSKRWPLIILAFLIVGLVRPHIAAIFIVGLAAQALVGAKVSAGRRFLLLAGVLALGALAIPVAFDYAGGIASLEDAQSIIQDRQTRNLGGGTSYDIISANPVWRLVTYTVRPFVWEARNIQGLISAIDNVVILGFLLVAILKLARTRRWPLENTGVIAFGLLGLLIFSATTANLGIALRQKWMFLPALMIGLLPLWEQQRPSSAKLSAR